MQSWKIPGRTSCGIHAVPDCKNACFLSNGRYIAFRFITGPNMTVHPGLTKDRLLAA